MKTAPYRLLVWLGLVVLGSTQTSAGIFIVASVADLQSALNQAANNRAADEVRVLPGTYDFSLLAAPVAYHPLNKPEPERYRLDVIGAGMGTTIFEGNEKRLWLSFSTGPNPSTDSTYSYDQGVEIHIEGITFRGIPRPPVDSGPVLVSAREGKISISQCEFVDCHNTGLDCGTVAPPLGGYAGDIEIAECSVRQNSGGVYGVVSVATVNGHIRVRDCSFTGNTYGTPLNLAATAGGTIEVRNSRFEANSAGNQSGGGLSGLLSAGGSIRVLASTFVGNSSAGHGGAIYLLGGGGTFLVDQNQFTSNRTGHYPSACVETELRYTQFTPRQGAIAIQKNSFVGNQGGGLYAFTGYLYASSATDAGVPIDVVGNLLQNNSGGGLRCQTVHGNIHLVNNTVWRNTGPGYGAWLQVYDNQSRADLFNNIIWGNQKTAEPASQRQDLQIEDDYRDSAMAWLPAPDGQGALLTLSHNDWSVLKLTAGNHSVQESNIDQDPRLKPDGRPEAGSPVIDAGNNDAAGVPEKDLTGNNRIQDGDGDHTSIVDLGAIEVPLVGRPALRLVRCQNGRCLFNWSPQANYYLESSQTLLFSTIDQSYSINSQDQELEVPMDSAPARFFRLKTR